MLEPAHSLPVDANPHDLALNHVLAGVYMCDAEGKIIYYNRHAAVLWGREPRLNHPADSWCGSYKQYAVSGALLPHQECWMARALLERRAYLGREFIVERPNGTRRRVLAYAKPILDEADRVRSAVNVLVDITELHESKQWLARSDNPLQALLQYIPDLVSSWDRKGFTRHLNSGVKGFGPLGASGIYVQDFVKSEYHPALQEALRIVFELREPVTLQYEGGGPADSFCWYETRLVPSALDGDFKSALAITSCIDARKKVEVALQQLTQGFYRKSGVELTASIVDTLAHLLNADAVGISELDPEDATGLLVRAQSINGKISTHIKYKYSGTPCEHVIAYGETIFDQQICLQFPLDARLTQLNAHTYVGERLHASDGRISGIIWAIFRQPVHDLDLVRTMLLLHSQREAAELERERAEKYKAQIEREHQSALDSLSEAIAILDAEGTILAVNAVWRNFARHETAHNFEAVGKNYIKVCEAVKGEDADVAAAVARAIRNAVAGQHDPVYIRYQCTTPEKVLWFMAQVCRVKESGPVRVLVSHRDISELVAQEQLLSKRENYIRSLAGSMSEGMLVFDLRGAIVSCNKSAQKILGLSEAQILKRTCSDARWGALKSNAQPYPLQELPMLVTLKTGREFIDEVLGLYGPEDSLRWLSINTTVLADASTGEKTGVVMTFHDITEKYAAAEKLRESQAQYHTLVSSMPGVVYRRELSRLVELNFVSYGIMELTGYAAEELRPTGSRSFHDLILKEDREDVRQALENWKSTNAGYRLEYRLEHKNGGVRWVYDTGHGERGASGAFIRVTGVMLDITARKEAELNLAQYRERLRTLNSQLVSMESSSRMNFASILHEEIGQTLGLARMKMGQLNQKLAQTPVQVEVQAVMGMLEDIITQTRALTFELSPPLLTQAGLAAALEWLAEHFSKEYQQRFAFERITEMPPLSVDWSSFLYRSARELLINSLKHAQATQTWMRLSHRDEKVILEVEDNGQGINHEASDAYGVGLFQMVERTQALGGTVRRENIPGSGCRVTIELPVPKSSGEAHANYSIDL